MYGMQSVAYDRSSAPKDCQVSAWFESPEEDPSSDVNKVRALTEFSYDLEKSNAQTFNVEARDSGGVINTVRLNFTSNHGSSALTCIYRFRVHVPITNGVETLDAQGHSSGTDQSIIALTRVENAIDMKLSQTFAISDTKHVHVFDGVPTHDVEAVSDPVASKMECDMPLQKSHASV
ncbi:hypothetical protein B296_00009093 [Ensete ventricosum]|uniref:SUN domain-containing protein n=1 Tax=Ensete ventricosum TaxID=4639 RepID=A0A426ZN70_ENSVE|nr:hypothetical protein B296_00009093 [Ensete ventricosum]